ncbi:uncharacterized protein LOC107981142 [Nasonia vitripennis]|uniref:Uncharacterized protein n=1 Tax=Nasonia vitripennis TaxID=7425 RepID=A0A7M7IS38_NASVI|nr:uncharacterized protein LOC107981142 [Nasonia vitripennis]
MAAKIVFLFLSCAVLTNFVQCQFNWLDHLKKCMIRDRMFTLILFIWDQSNKRQAQEVSQIFSDWQNNVSMIIMDKDSEYGILDEYLLYSSNLIISILQIKENYSVRNVQREFSGATSYAAPQKMTIYFIIVYHSPNISNEMIKSTLIRWHKLHKDAPLKVLEIIENVRNTNTLRNSKSTSTALMHSYDYYTKLYSITAFSKIHSIFDLSQVNLQNKVLTMVLKPNPPNLDAQLNSDGCYDSQTLVGPQGLILKQIAESSNFQWKILKESYQFIRQARKTSNQSCIVYDSFSNLVGNKIDVMGNFEYMPYLLNFEKMNSSITAVQLKYLGKSYMRRSEPLVVIVPILYRNGIQLSENFLTLFISTLVIVIIIRITVKLMKFNDEVWNIKNILYAIFGMDIAISNANITESIILTCILFLSVIYSVGIIDELVDIQLELNQLLEMNTLVKLQEYNLSLMTDNYNKYLLLESHNPAVISLAENAITTFDYKIREDCINNLLLKSYKNLTCMQYQSKAESVVRNSILIHGEANVKILKEYLVMHWATIFTRPKFLYVKRFEQVVQYLTEAGLVDKWYKTEMIRSKEEKKTIVESNDLENNPNTSQGFRQLLTVAIFGYILAFIILIGEIIASRFGRKFSFSVFLNNMKTKVFHPVCKQINLGFKRTSSQIFRIKNGLISGMRNS